VIALRRDLPLSGHDRHGCLDYSEGGWKGDLHRPSATSSLGDSSPDVLINTYGARLLGAEQRHRGLKPNSTLFRLIEDDQELPREMHPLERAARAGETVSNWQGRLEPDLGDSAQVMISAIPLFTEAGVVRGAIAAIVDISRLKKVEARIPRMVPYFAVQWV
jgi:hypothetical protein